jgi:hypothetical protein
MSDSTLLVAADLSEARAKSKDVRAQLRALEETLRSIAADVSEQTTKSSAAVSRLERVRVNVTRAIDELLCTDTTQGPF